MPAKPPNIIVERWLPYKQQKRQVIYEKANEQLSSKIDSKSSNELIIQYANPSVRIEKQMSSLGIVRCDPFERIKHSSSKTTGNDNSSLLLIDFSFSFFKNLFIIIIHQQRSKQWRHQWIRIDFSNLFQHRLIYFRIFVFFIRTCETESEWWLVLFPK